MKLRLSWLISFKFYIKHYKKLILTILSISLGISLYLCVNSYKFAIEQFLSNKLNLFNTHNYVISSTTGTLSYENFKAINKSKYIKNSAPFNEKIVHIKESKNTLKTVTLITTDLFQFSKLKSKSNNKESDNLFSNDYACIYPTEKEQIEIVIDESNYLLNVYLPASKQMSLKNTILIDIVSYEHWFKEPITFNYITADIYNIEKFKYELKNISPNLIIQSKNSHQKNNKKMTDSFIKNLEFLSLLAILISIFISYQFFFFIITERQKQFNTIRALGMSTKEVLYVLITEIIIISIITWVISLCMGYVLSIFSLSAIEKTITEFFMPLTISSQFFNSYLLLKTFFITLFSISLSSLHPILKITSKSIQYRNYYPSQINTKSYLILSIIGILILLLTFYISKVSTYTYQGYFILLGVTLFFLLQLPTLLKICTKLLKIITPKQFKLPLSYIKDNIIHHSTLIFTLCLSMSLYLCLFIFISSFRLTVTDWINSVNWADYYIHHKQTTIQTPVTINSNITSKLISHSDVIGYDILSRYDAFYKQNKIKVIAGNYKFLEKNPSRLKLKNPIKSSLNKLGDVLISETFATKFNVTINDIIIIEGPFGSYECNVKNIFFAYLNDQGYVYMSDTLAKNLFKSLPNHGIGLLINKKKSNPTFYKDFHDYLDQNTIYLDSFIDLKESVITTFNSTFKITWSLAFIAAFIAGFTLINYISMFLLQFEKTFIQLRTLGAPHSFIKRLMLWQNNIIMLISFVYSIAVSLAFSYILIVYINKPIFGWTIYFKISPIAFVQVFIIAFIILYLTTTIMYNRKKSIIESTKLNYEI